MLKKIREVVKDSAVKIDFCFSEREQYGIIDGNEVSINLLKCLLPTMIHEVLHFLYPLYDEEVILEMEATVYESLSYQQKINLFQLFVEGGNKNGRNKKRKNKISVLPKMP
jgi:hypothetical protein